MVLEFLLVMEFWNWELGIGSGVGFWDIGEWDVMGKVYYIPHLLNHVQLNPLI